LVLRNAMFLIVGQVVATPLSILINAVMGRYLGPADFGYLYLVGTFLSFAFLFVQWGQNGTLPTFIARDRSRAGAVLGSALSWRLGFAPIVYGILAALCALLGYSRDLQLALAIAFIGTVIATASSTCQDVVRGFERTDVAAISQVASSLLGALIVVPVLLLGGRLNSVLVAQAFAGLIVLAIIARALRGIGVTRLSVDREILKSLLRDGTAFLVFGVTMVLQPSIDAAFLSRLGSAESVGWQAAASKLIGVLLMPASALVTALYPTLSRLFGSDKRAFEQTTTDALRTAIILAVPLAVGCALYPDLGVQIFSRKAFGPARENLRLLAPYLFLVYLSMPLGVSLAACGRTKIWAGAQALCLVVSAVLDPLLVPRFQAWRGNGGLGICISTCTSEVLMVAAAVALSPRGFWTRSVWKTSGSAALAGLAMAGTAYLTSGITAFVGAPLAALGYLVCLWATGGLGSDQLATIKSIVSRKARRRAPAV
jgi:O-antigen/teichoic acid export membrane protein